MKRILLTATILLTVSNANNAQELFNTKCATCHKIEKDIKDKSSLIAPPVDRVMMHIKQNFKDKKEAISFIKSFALNPDPTKTLCPSIDIFGLMPSQKGVVTEEELDTIANYMYDNFPKNGNMQMGMGRRGKGGCRGGKRGFMRMDKNGDGFISKDEFNQFRAEKEGVDVKKFKYDFFFKKIDKNGDGKLDKEEFRAFRRAMRGK